jgi:hypothetical protein
MRLGLYARLVYLEYHYFMIHSLLSGLIFELNLDHIFWGYRHSRLTVNDGPSRYC